MLVKSHIFMSVNAEFDRAAKRDMFIYYALITLVLVISGFLFLNHFKGILVLLAVERQGFRKFRKRDQNVKGLNG